MSKLYSSDYSRFDKLDVSDDEIEEDKTKNLFEEAEALKRESAHLDDVLAMAKTELGATRAMLDAAKPKAFAPPQTLAFASRRSPVLAAR